MTPDSSAWPKAWLTIVYKQYASAERITLPRASAPDISLANAIATRKTDRAFSGEPLSPHDLSMLLLYGCGLQEVGGTRRAQPSGGGLYPIEAYVINFAAGELPAGAFHYNVRDHVLETIERRSFSADDRARLFVEFSSPNAAPRFAQDASCAIVLTAVFDRSQNKYGERGYRYCLLEAGHIGQNLSLVATSLDLACAPLGGVVDDELERIVRADGDEESLVYVLILGPHTS